MSLVKFDEQRFSLRQAIEKSLDLIDFQFNKNTRKIVIKPNLCYYWDYSTGETTDPRFVRELVDILRDYISSNVEISVVESDASAMKCKYAFRMLGYLEMTKEKKVGLVNLTNDKADKASVRVKGKTYEFLLPRTIKEADIIVNIPKIKYMQRCRFSGALKNIYGCNPRPKKYRYHDNLDDTIVGLNKLMSPSVCIVDGIIVKGITTLKLGLIMASTDSVAVDAAASQILSINPRSIGYLKLACEENIGCIDFKVKGERLSKFKRLYPRKTFQYKMRNLLSKIYLRFVAT